MKKLSTIEKDLLKRLLSHFNMDSGYPKVMVGMGKGIFKLLPIGDDELFDDLKAAKKLIEKK